MNIAIGTNPCEMEIWVFTFFQEHGMLQSGCQLYAVAALFTEDNTVLGI